VYPTDEIIVAFQPDASPEAFFQRQGISQVVPLAGTADQFVVTIMGRAKHLPQPRPK
jgi:hypothetical protein